MELPQFTRASMFLRLVCGLWLVGSAMAAGFMLRSPWIVGPLGLAFAVLFVIGKWTAWKQSIQTLGWKGLPTGLLTLIPSQIVIVGIFYAPCLGFMKTDQGRARDRPLWLFRHAICSPRAAHRRCPRDWSAPAGGSGFAQYASVKHTLAR